MAPTEEKRLTERTKAAACFFLSIEGKYCLGRQEAADGGTPILHDSSVASLMKFLSKPSPRRQSLHSDQLPTSPLS